MQEDCRAVTAWIGAAILAAGVVSLARADDEKPAKKAAYAMTLTGDVPAEMAPVAGKLTEVFFESYPKLVARFEHPNKPAARSVRVTFAQGMKVPAYCTGNEIKVSVDWLKEHPEDVGLLTHELTHVVQAYPPSDAGWLTEGIADYARHLYGPAKQPGWSLPQRLTRKQNYKDGYGVTARFLVWLEAKHPGVVDKLHRRLQDREYAEADFKKLTGTALADLWDECVQDLGKKPE